MNFVFCDRLFLDDSGTARGRMLIKRGSKEKKGEKDRKMIIGFQIVLFQLMFFQQSITTFTRFPVNFPPLTI